jgi:glycosyltransferase involved in cell wall biosynthesis
VRPTVSEDNRVSVESHLLDYSGNLYGRQARVEFYAFLRPEQKFDSFEALSAQIHALHAEDYIILKGFSSDIHAVMAHSSGFVLPSNYEGLSNSLLEALCIGVPCVSTDHAPGSAREYITSGENGFLTKVGDAQDMKEKICALIENEELSRTFAERNLAIRERLDVEVICKEWAKLFN